MPIGQYMSNLTEISLKKLEILKSIFELTLKQEEAIAEQNLDGLGRLIDKKQKLIDKTVELDKEFEGYYAKLKSYLKVDSITQIKDGEIYGIKELKSAINEVMVSIRTITGKEAQNSQEANKLLNSISNEIKRINLSKKTMGGYNRIPNAYQTQSSFIDQKK